MKTLKITLHIILLTIFTMSMKSSFCQKPASQPGKHGSQDETKEQKREEMKLKMDEIESKLNLTPEQAMKIADIKRHIKQETKGKMMALPADAPREEKGKIIKEAMANANAQIMKVLNSDQQTIYKAEKAKLKEEMKEKRQERKKTMDN